MFTPDLNKHASVSSVCASAPGAPDQFRWEEKTAEAEKSDRYLGKRAAQSPNSLIPVGLLVRLGLNGSDLW